MTLYLWVELHAVPKFLSIITPKCLDSLSAAWLSEWFSHPDCWVSYILHAWIELAWKRTDLSQLYHNCIANRHHNQNNATPTNRPTVYYQPKKSSKKMTLQHLQTQKNPPKKSTLLAPFKTTLSQTLPKPTNPSPPFFKLSFPASGRGLLSSTGPRTKLFEPPKKATGRSVEMMVVCLDFLQKTCTW